MKRLFPASLSGRVILLLFLGMVASHLASFMIYSNDHFDTMSAVYGREIAERVSAITALVDGTPVSMRPALIRGFQGTSLQLQWSPASALPDGPASDEISQTVYDIVMRRMGNWESDALSVNYRRDSPADDDFRYYAEGFVAGRWLGIGHKLDELRQLNVSVRLHDRTWLNFTAPLERFHILHQLRFVLSNLLMLLTVMGLAIWSLWMVTTPIAAFAKAAERLGRDVNAPPLDLKGPSEVRKAIGAFNQMQERLRRFVADRTQMLAAISHDLRTPMTRLRLRAEFMEDEQQRLKLLSDLDEMEAMVLSTLAFAREDSIGEDVRKVDLKTEVEGLCTDMADAGLPVRFVGGKRQFYRCRPRALRRAIGNFIDNALKYGQNAWVKLHREGKDAVIEIEDDGPGIPEEEMSKVFAPFYRIEYSRNRDTGGVGLGLAVARNIIHAHGGEVALANRAEGGLTVTVRLPG